MHYVVVTFGSECCEALGKRMQRDVRSGRDPYRNVHLYPFGLPLNSNRGANDARTKLKRILSLWQTQYPFNFNILNVSIEQLKKVY